LLHRTTRKLRLTDVGEQYFQHCAAAIQAIDEAEASVRAANDQPRGKLRITAPFSLEAELGASLTSFLVKHPDVRVSVALEQRMVDLIGENFDLAIRATGHLPDSTLVARPLSSGYSALFASPSYLSRHPPVLSPDDLKHHDTITFGENERTWQLLGEADTAIEVPITPRLVVNEPTLAMTVAAAGGGIALLPFDFTGRIEADGLQRVLPAYRGQRARLYLVYPSAKLMSATLRALRDHLTACWDAPELP
jgi:DNA-binding transcriptional LysR family regulator